MAKRVLFSIFGDTKKHFFASSALTWKTSTDVREVTRHMEEEGLTYNLWLVPLPHSSDYDINHFTPQVEGSVYLGLYHPKQIGKQPE